MLAVSIDIFPKELLDAIIRVGPFAIGTVFGCLVTMWSNYQAGKERIQKDKLETEHLKQLLKQNKDQHERIVELQNGVNSVPTSSGKQIGNKPPDAGRKDGK